MDDKVGLFIDRCIDESGYTCRILLHEIQQELQRNGMHNIIKDNIYQQIMVRLSQRIQSGEE